MYDTDAHQWERQVLDTSLASGNKISGKPHMPAPPTCLVLRSASSSLAMLNFLSDITRPLIISPGNDRWPQPKPCLPSLGLGPSKPLFTCSSRLPALSLAALWS